MHFHYQIASFVLKYRFQHSPRESKPESLVKRLTKQRQMTNLEMETYSMLMLGKRRPENYDLPKIDTILQ